MAGKKSGCEDDLEPNSVWGAAPRTFILYREAL